MHRLEELLEGYCERTEKELRDLYSKISKNETMLPPQDLDSMDKLLHSLKSIKTVMAMLDYSDEDGGYASKYKGYTKRSTPHYSESRDSIRVLESLMSRARTDSEAMAIQDAINRLEG